MEKYLLEYKKPGETPLDCINRVKNGDKAYTHVPMTYAGRLDPMAEGLMIILAGDECQNKDKYNNMPKTYEVDVLFGFATDTYDLLGLVGTSSKEGFERSSDLLSGRLTPQAGQTIPNPSFDFASISSEISTKLQNFTGKINQKYPAYSSRTVAGKPLFQWAREGRLSEIDIPSHDVFVENIEIKKTKEITGKKLMKYITDSISQVKGDFRQEEILAKWHEVLNDNLDKEFQVVKLVISCSSGTYVRAIAHELGQSLGTQALAMHILRTQIGEYKI